MTPVALLLIAALTIRINAGHEVDYEGRIVNGAPILASEYPWMVSLRYQVEITVNGTNYTVTAPHFCGASLFELSPPIVMTAAHCFDSFGFQEGGKMTESQSDNSSTITIALDLGRTQQQRAIALTDPFADTMYETLYVSDWNNIYIHPQYNISNPTNGYDIALFVMDDNQTVSGVIEAELPLLQMQLDGELCCEDGESLTAIGYGDNETDGSLTKQLEMTSLTYLEPKDCAIRYTKLLYKLTNRTINETILAEALTEFDDDYDTESEFEILCATGVNTNICQGDSGGPLFVMNQGYTEIKGVASFVVGGCNNGSFSGWTPVGRYYDWIQQTIDYAVYGITSSPTSNPTKEPTESPIDSNTSGDSQYPFNYVMGIIISFVYALFFV